LSVARFGRLFGLFGERCFDGQGGPETVWLAGDRVYRHAIGQTDPGGGGGMRKGSAGVEGALRNGLIGNAEGYVLIAVYLFVCVCACYSHNSKSIKPNRMKFGAMIGYYPGTI